MVKGRANVALPKEGSNQWGSQEFCSGGASHWRRQISNLAISHKNHFDVTGQFLVYYNRIWRQITSTQWASITFNKGKKTLAFAVIIIKQLLIFNEHLRAAESEAPCNVVLENITDYAYWISPNQLKVGKWMHRNKSEDANSQILTLQNTCEHKKR